MKWNEMKWNEMKWNEMKIWAFFWYQNWMVFFKFINGFKFE